MIDADYHPRLKLLAELMEQNPESKVRDLQRECLKYYPLHYQATQRSWLGIRTAFAAADILNAPLLAEHWEGMK